MIVTLGSGEETTVVGWGRDRVVVVSLGEYLVIGMMTGVNTSEEPARRHRRWIDKWVER